MDPFTGIAVASMATAAAGGIVGGLGAKQEGDANAAAYRYKAGVALLNKQINEQNAQWSLEAGGVKSQEIGLKAKSQIGATKVLQSASGFDVNTGNNKAVRDTQTDVAQFEENVISFDAAKSAWGYRAKGSTDVAESRLDLMAADTSEQAGTIGMIGSFISGAGNVSSKWMQGRSAGAF